MPKKFPFSKENVLRKNRQFQTVYKTGKSYANKYLVLYVMVKKDGPRRIGFAVGKRLGGAVVRNRIKRILRESFRLNQHCLKKDIDIIVIGRQPIVGRNFEIVNKAMLDLFGKAKVLEEQT